MVRHRPALVRCGTVPLTNALWSTAAAVVHPLVADPQRRLHEPDPSPGILPGRDPRHSPHGTEHDGTVHVRPHYTHPSLGAQVISNPLLIASASLPTPPAPTMTVCQPPTSLQLPMARGTQ
jgi:hypothetical protein